MGAGLRCSCRLHFVELGGGTDQALEKLVGGGNIGQEKL